MEKIKDKYKFNLKTFDTTDLTYNSLNSGSIDAMMDDQPVIEYAIKQGQNLKISMKGKLLVALRLVSKKEASMNI